MPRSCSLAIVAATAKQDFRDFPNGLADALAARGELDVIKARDIAADGAKKVGVRIRIVLARTNLFETVDVVAQFGTADQAGFGHVV